MSRFTLSLIPPIALAIATPAAAEFTYSNDTGGSANFYGQINPAWQSVNDGSQTKDTFVDNAHSNSRLGFNVFQEFGAGYRLRFRVEAALGARQSSAVSQEDTPPSFDWSRSNIRHVDLQLRTPGFGTISFGQGSMAGDGMGQIDKSGTGLVNYVASSGDGAGSFEFRGPDGSLSGITVSDVLSDFDPSRRGRIRYDTPELAGFSFAIAYGKDILSQDTDRDDYFTGAHLSYAHSFANDIALEAGIGYQRRDRRPDIGQSVKRDDVFGSASILLPSGFSFSAALGNRDTQGKSFDTQYWYVKAGYEADFFRIGPTAVSIDYFDGSDYEEKSDSSQAWGIGLVQTIEPIHGEFYLGFRRNDYKQQLVNFDTVDVFLLGARFSF